MKSFWGKVMKGAQRGKTLGFPTANIALHKKIAEGIYVAKIKVHGSQFTVGSKQTMNNQPTNYKRGWYPALTFIGDAKTFNETKVQAETYLLDFSGNLYGQYITVRLLKKIRDNKKFDSVDELKKQMQEDVVNAKKFFLE